MGVLMMVMVIMVMVEVLKPTCVIGGLGAPITEVLGIWYRISAKIWKLDFILKVVK